MVNLNLIGMDEDFDLDNVRWDNVETIKERYKWAGKFADKRANTYLRYWHYDMMEGAFNKKKDRHIGLGGWITDRNTRPSATKQDGVKGRDIFIPFHPYTANKSLIEDIRKSELNARKKGWNGNDLFYTTLLPEDLPAACLIWLDWDYLMKLYVSDDDINNLLSEGKTYDDICFEHGFFKGTARYNIDHTMSGKCSWRSDRSDKYSPEILVRPVDIRHGLAVSALENNKNSLLGMTLNPGRMNTPELYPMDTIQYPHFSIMYADTKISRFIGNGREAHYFDEVSDERLEERILQQSQGHGLEYTQAYACINPYCHRIIFPNGDKWIPSQGMVRK